MRTSTLVSLTAVTAAAVSLLPLTGHAHIDPLKGMKSRSSSVGAADTTQKKVPCDGDTWGMNGSYTFAPGATITLGVDESLGHPGYFRVAFDSDADASFVDPVSIKPFVKDRKCPFNEWDRCTASDFCTPYAEETGVTVLWDNLNAHKAGLLKTQEWSWQITLPDIECEKCTIQIIQVMEDTIHTAYNTTDADEPNHIDDVYHRCFDVTLKRGAAANPGMTTTTKPAPQATDIDCSQTVIMDDGGVQLPDPGTEGGDTGGGNTGSASGGASAGETGGGSDTGDGATDGSSSDDGTTTTSDPASEGDKAAGQAGNMSGGCSLTGASDLASHGALGVLLLGTLGWLYRRRSAPSKHDS